MIFITGGAGFIGSNFVRDWLVGSNEPIINLDKLTYAGNLASLQSISDDPRHTFIQGDISDYKLLRKLLIDYQPRAVVHFAAESHVDRSIQASYDFIQTNIVGTFHLLEETLRYWKTLTLSQKIAFRFVHVSTDEVYGSLEPTESPFSENRRYQPNNPYSASKAASDHLVHAWHHTYGLPILITHCSNNYGPYHFPEKLIPLCISNALANKSLSIYGDGQHIRDWLFVSDHCDAIRCILQQGVVGETYNIGSGNEKSTVEVVNTICSILDELCPRENGASYAHQITFVKDRPGHDRRYAIDSCKLQRNLGWKPKETFETGIKKTVQWYLNNSSWLQSVMNMNPQHGA